MSNNAKIIYSLIGVLLLLLAGFFIYFSTDAAPYDDKHLAYYPEVISEEENGYSKLSEANSLFVKVREVKKKQSAYIANIGKKRIAEAFRNCLDYTKFDEELAKEYIRLNQDCLEKINEAMQYSRVYSPPPKGYNELSREYIHASDIVNLLLLKAHLYRFRLNEIAYCDQINKTLKTIKVFTENSKQVGLIASVKYRGSLVLMSIRKAVQSGFINPGKANERFGSFEKYQLSLRNYEIALKCSYLFMKNNLSEEPLSVYGILPGDYRVKYLFKRNKTLRLFGEHVTRCLANKDKVFTPDLGYVSSVSYFQKLSENRFHLNYVNNNIFGIFLFTHEGSNIEYFCSQRVAYHSELSLLDALIAVKRYEKKEGDLPDQLEDLVPTYLAKVPVDEQDKMPVKYSKVKKKLWVLFGPRSKSHDLDYVKKSRAIIYLNPIIPAFKPPK